jgi:hypothetical protein
MEPTYGKWFAILGTVAFLVQIVRMGRRWWGNRKREQRKNQPRRTA